MSEQPKAARGFDLGSGQRSGEWLYASMYQQTGSFHLGLPNFGIFIINFNPTTVLMLQLPSAYKQRIIIFFSTMRSKEWDISARSSAHSSRLQLLSEMQWMPVHLASIPCLVGLTQLITKKQRKTSDSIHPDTIQTTHYLNEITLTFDREQQ